MEAPFYSIAQAGQQIFALGENIQKINNDMEFSSLKRQAEEINNAAYLAIDKENDPSARKQIWEQSRKDIGSLQGKGGAVNREFQKYTSTVMPAWDRYFADLNQTKALESAKADLEFNADKALELGDMTEYQRLYGSAKEAGLITDIEYKYQMDNAETNMVFARARVLMNDSPELAIETLENAPNLSGQQLDYKDRLVGHARSLQRSRQIEAKAEYDKIYNELYTRAYVNNEPITVAELQQSGLPAKGDYGWESFWNNYQKTINKQIPENSALQSIQNAELIIADVRHGRESLRAAQNQLSSFADTINPDDMKSYMSRLTNAEELNRVNPVRAEKVKQYSDQILKIVGGESINPQERKDALALSASWDNWVQSNPNATQQQMDEAFNDLFNLEKYRNWMDKYGQSKPNRLKRSMSFGVNMAENRERRKKEYQSILVKYMSDSELRGLANQ